MTGPRHYQPADRGIRGRRRLAPAVTVAICSVLAQLPARAAPPSTSEARSRKEARISSPDSTSKVSDADRHFRRGVELYDDGDAGAAAVEFSRAYQIVPHYKILYNLGQVAYQRQDYVQALDYFLRYLKDGGDALPRERRQKVEQDVRRVEQRIGHIDISLDGHEDGAQVLIDDVRAASTPVSEPVPANVGQRKVEIIHKSGQRELQVVDVVGAETVKVRFARPVVLQLVADASSAHSASRRAEASSLSEDSSREDLKRSRGKTSIPWFSWTVAGALAGAAAVTGGLAYAASRDLQERRDGYPLAPGDLDAWGHRARTLALTTDGLLVGALVMTAVSLYLTVSPPTAEDNNRDTVITAARKRRSESRSLSAQASVGD